MTRILATKFPSGAVVSTLLGNFSLSVDCSPFLDFSQHKLKSGAIVSEPGSHQVLYRDHNLEHYITARWQTLGLQKKWPSRFHLRSQNTATQTFYNLEI